MQLHKIVLSDSVDITPMSSVLALVNYSELLALMHEVSVTDEGDVNAKVAGIANPMSKFHTCFFNLASLKKIFAAIERINQVTYASINSFTAR